MEFLVMDNFAIYCFHFQQYTMQVKNIDGRKKVEALDQTKVVFEQKKLGYYQQGYVEELSTTFFCQPHNTNT